ncbi:PAN2-PAN3 deadenylation complex catalytic subunit PAN2 [Nilaparvata lugens]|uniref:PAN2-PAN3 deadenylation complex catalytic subunit PAN2 n=1 Tax=Nilaparvata lugens TaxID=108931 RepID=UPI00193D587C|nr:PAN2-PAN3 deadenylation complex catalytic subunit PAN2 [Nilaparvata lugens]
MDLRSRSLRPYDTGHEELLLYEDVVQAEESFTYNLEGNFEEYANVEAEFQERRTILVDGGDRFGVSAVAFDLQEELLWMGNQGGHVTSYYGADLQKHTSFQIHASEDVRCLHTFDDGILALTPSSLRCQMRRGIPIFTHTSANMEEMQCLLQLSQSPQSLLMAGHSHNLIEFNLSTCQEVNLVDVGDQGCALLRQHPRFICCGNAAGQITLRDPNSLHIEHTLEAHTASLSDFDVHENLLVTCGFSNRQGSLGVDRFLLVFDVRMMRVVSPIPLLLDPLLLRFMPTFSSRIAVASTIGQLQLVDTHSISEPDLTVYQVNNANSMCLALDVSPSCQAITVGDSGGSIHLLTSSDRALFNTFSRPTEFADPIETYPPISIDDRLAILAAVPLAFQPPSSTVKQKLLSDWPKEFLQKVNRQTPPIDPEILQSMKMNGTIGYAPNPNTKLRNQVAYISVHNSPQNGTSSSDTKSMDHQSRSLMNSPANVGGGVGGASSAANTFVAIPKRYRKMEVKYSKPGVQEELDYLQYNKTCFSGLEAHLPNSYCNSLIQVLYFVEPLRRLLLSHVCYNEFCLSCELAFLFHMLDVSRPPKPCHPGNFLRSLRMRNAHEATGQGGNQVPDLGGGGGGGSAADKRKANYTTLIQNWNRFILHQIHYELMEEKKRKKESPKSIKDNQSPKAEQQPSKNQAKRKSKSEATEQETSSAKSLSSEGESADISNLFGSKQLHIHRCLTCGHTISRESSLLVCNLIYPEQIEGEMSFCEVLRSSLCPEQTTPAWCDQCERFQPTLQSRRLQQLPTLLTVNCGMDSVQEKKFWQNQMDGLVKKALDAQQGGSEGGSPGGGTGGGPTSNKPCRYGNACTRVGCRFKHPGRQEASSSSNVSPSHLYCSHSWLPQHIQLNLSSTGEVSIKKLAKTEVDSVDLSSNKVPGKQTIVYDLYAVVCYINEEKKNLVSIVNVSQSYHSRSANQQLSQWYIFNDFSVSPVNGQEAVWFSLDWKVPCILYFVDRSLEASLAPHTNPITVDVLSEDISLARCGKGITFVPLETDELPGPGDLVAMDAEFVTLNQEDQDSRADGKSSASKPSHMSVARISCVRGQGALKGTPFIDDYISTQEQVADYLTQFSGIKPGDLDVNSSQKHLTTLKSTYLKLRYLVDSGVKFVGHGLRNDFRVINLVVPPEQVIDTVHLFHLQHQRMVSLRFLAWHYLEMKIQSETHDSIEDARAALQLYELYQKLEAEGKVKSSLEEMYKVGKSVQWKVPGVDS